MSAGGRGPASYRWWLRLQLILTAAGGAVWVAGMVTGRSFLTGTGLGLFLGALALRMGRRAAEDSPHRSTEDREDGS